MGLADPSYITANASCYCDSNYLQLLSTLKSNPSSLLKVHFYIANIDKQMRR